MGFYHAPILFPLLNLYFLLFLFISSLSAFKHLFLHSSNDSFLLVIPLSPDNSLAFINICFSSHVNFFHLIWLVLLTHTHWCRVNKRENNLSNNLGKPQE